MLLFCSAGASEMSDSKSISVNVGMESGVSLNCRSRSKSDGTGIDSTIVWVGSDISWGVIFVLSLKTDV